MGKRYRYYPNYFQLTKNMFDTSAGFCKSIKTEGLIIMVCLPTIKTLRICLFVCQISNWKFVDTGLWIIEVRKVTFCLKLTGLFTPMAGHHMCTQGEAPICVVITPVCQDIFCNKKLFDLITCTWHIFDVITNSMLHKLIYAIERDVDWRLHWRSIHSMEVKLKWLMTAGNTLLHIQFHCYNFSRQ